MAFRQSAAEDEHGLVDAGAGDGDFSCVDAIDGFGDGRARGFVARAREPVRVFVAMGASVGEVTSISGG